MEVEGEGEGGGAAPDAPVVPVPVPDDEEPLLEPEDDDDAIPLDQDDDDVEDEALIVKAKPGRKKTTVKKTELHEGYFMNDKRFDGDIAPAHIEQADETWYSK